MSVVRFFRDRKGATVVEFAMVAPLFLTALLGLMEGARLLWTKQALNEAAYSTARCRMVGGAVCNGAAKQIAYAVQRASANGVPVTAANVQITESTTCNGSANSVRVTITRSFGSPIAKLVPIAETVQGTACLPKLG